MHQAGIALFLVASAIAQDTAYTATYAASSITSSASLTETTSASYVSNTKGPTTHIIEAGKGGHTFSPDIVLAEVGDTIGMDIVNIESSNKTNILQNGNSTLPTTLSSEPPTNIPAYPTR